MTLDLGWGPIEFLKEKPAECLGLTESWRLLPAATLHRHFLVNHLLNFQEYPCIFFIFPQRHFLLLSSFTFTDPQAVLWKFCVNRLVLRNFRVECRLSYGKFFSFVLFLSLQIKSNQSTHIGKNLVDWDKT